MPLVLSQAQPDAPYKFSAIFAALGETKLDDLHHTGMNQTIAPKLISLVLAIIVTVAVAHRHRMN